MVNWDALKNAIVSVYSSFSRKIQPVDEPDYIHIAAMAVPFSGGEVNVTVHADAEGVITLVPSVKVAAPPSPEAVKAIQAVMEKSVGSHSRQGTVHTTGTVITSIVGSFLTAWVLFELFALFRLG